MLARSDVTVAANAMVMTTQKNFKQLQFVVFAVERNQLNI